MPNGRGGSRAGGVCPFSTGLAASLQPPKVGVLQGPHSQGCNAAASICQPLGSQPRPLGPTADGTDALVSKNLCGVA